jgi:hypothetical protein
MKTGIKMKVNQEQSAKIQEIVFANGGCWQGGNVEVQLTDQPFLCLCDEKYITWILWESMFEQMENEEVTADSFIANKGKL